MILYLTLIFFSNSMGVFHLLSQSLMCFFKKCLMGMFSFCAFTANPCPAGNDKDRQMFAQYIGLYIGIDVSLIYTAQTGEALTKLALLECQRTLVIHTPLTLSHVNGVPELLNNQPIFATPNATNTHQQIIMNKS